MTTPKVTELRRGSCYGATVKALTATLSIVKAPTVGEIGWVRAA